MFHFSNFSEYPNISHIVTDRKFEEITLKHGQELLAKELAIEPEQIILIDQVHENMVVEAKVGVLKKADAVATNKPGL